jgi:lipoprotein-releasing system permease protein
MLVSLPLARRLFCYDEQTVSALRIEVKGTETRRIKKEITRLLGEQYQVLDRYEQQADFFRILRIEKLLTFLLLAFILLIASFNIIGSLSSIGISLSNLLYLRI